MMARTPIERTRRGFARFVRDVGGGVAMVFGLAIVPVIGSVGVAVDANAWMGERARLQNAADTAAIAAAREMRMLNTPPAQLEQAAETALLHVLGPDAAAAQVNARVDTREHAVRVDVTMRLEPSFSRFVTDAFSSVAVTSTARVRGSAPICVVGLDPSAGKTVFLEKRAQLDARGCAVYSNSTSRQGMRIDNQAQIRAALICSAGGRTGPHAAFSPQPRTDCPPLPDPLAGRPAPSVGGCDHTDLVIKRDQTLSPGVYCGGLKIENGAEVNLRGGLYVIKDGKLEVDEGGLFGRYVSFYFVGEGALLEFKPKSSIDLTAMKDGVLAGILVYEDRRAQPGRDFKIESNDARNLLGTIYLPQGDLHVRSEQAVADRSAFTVIVARTLELSEGPVLTLNTDYGATDIPVPEGVGPTGDVVLSQ